jgi:hypothetical protein
MREERTPAKRRGRIGRELERIESLAPEIAAWELHLARRALFGEAGPVAARRARTRYTTTLLAALEVRASEWREWAMFRHDSRFRPAGMGYPRGSFFLGDVLFADGTGTDPYCFDLRTPYQPEAEEEQPSRPGESR